MDPQDDTINGVPLDGTERTARALISLAEDLEGALVRMDALGLSLAANHVSQGIELIRSEVDSLHSGDS